MLWHALEFVFLSPPSIRNSLARLMLPSAILQVLLWEGGLWHFHPLAPPDNKQCCKSEGRKELKDGKSGALLNSMGLTRPPWKYQKLSETIQCSMLLPLFHQTADVALNMQNPSWMNPSRTRWSCTDSYTGAFCSWSAASVQSRWQSKNDQKRWRNSLNMV